MDLISKDVQKYMAEKGLEFSDLEKAAIIYNSRLPIKEKHETLEKLAEETEDGALKQQIADRLHDDRQVMETFANNAEGYVYVVMLADSTGEEQVYGYFADLQTACANAMTKGRGFGIEKFKVISSENYPSRKIKKYTDLYSLAKQEHDVFAWDDDLYPQAGFYYHGDGALSYFWSSEIKRADKAVPDEWEKGRFEHSPVRMPNPFERGDIVRYMEDEEYGIVETSQEEWRSLTETTEQVEFSDSNVSVFLFANAGDVGYYNLSPIFLEKYEPQKDDGNYELLMLGREAYTGNIPMERFSQAVDDYKKRQEM